ncbi:MAG: Lrp/AsnC family transcriptional regulator [Candidatus Binatia bacterium]|nr:Lrp/AsnC family transcriptional regulator [Candidatus Binatia bacterium]
MKLGNRNEHVLDAIDLKILETVQADCKIPLARVGEQVGLSAPSVIDRIKKLESAGVITGYHAALDSQELGLDVTAFIGVEHGQLADVTEFENLVGALEGVLECHHVTGQHTFLLKAKTENTSSLESLISQIRNIPGVARTETMVVLSTHIERSQVPLPGEPTQTQNSSPRRRSRATGNKPVAAAS